MSSQPHLCTVCSRQQSRVEQCDDGGQCCQVCLGLFTAATAEMVFAAVRSAADQARFKDMDKVQMVFTLPGSCVVRAVSCC